MMRWKALPSEFFGVAFFELVERSALHSACFFSNAILFNTPLTPRETEGKGVTQARLVFTPPSF